jgi:hypothetical protein
MDYILGAYASAPSVWKKDKKDKKEESTFYDSLKENLENIKGLEIPFYGKNIHQFGDEYLIEKLDDSWMNTITLIPASFNALKKNIHFGLSSDHEESRLLAIESHKKLNSIVKKINDSKGKKVISSIQICSSPSFPKKNVSSSKDSFKKSIETLLSWDWEGANLLIEHCDSQRDFLTYQKGFLSIEKEIEILDELKNKSLGICLNWGRSVLEGQNTNEIIKHIKLAQKNKYLKGFIFSGTSPLDKNFGSWTDFHMPFYNQSCYINSLLTEKNVRLSLDLINFDELDYLGIKLQPLPQEKTTVRKRININRDAIEIINKTLLNLSIKG